MDHDEPNFVSAVTDSAFLLRENISKTLEKYPGVSGPMRNYAMLLRDEIKDFLDRIKNVRTRPAPRNLHGEPARAIGTKWN
jgi:hypothetical protein